MAYIRRLNIEANKKNISNTINSFGYSTKSMDSRFSKASTGTGSVLFLFFVWDFNYLCFDLYNDILDKST